MTMTTSPMLNTSWPGNQRGVAKMSPSTASLGCASTAELAKCPGCPRHPEAASARALAGIVPLLATMAVRLSAPPKAMGSRPGMRRFDHTNTPAAA